MLMLAEYKVQSGMGRCHDWASGRAKRDTVTLSAFAQVADMSRRSANSGVARVDAPQADSDHDPEMGIEQIAVPFAEQALRTALECRSPEAADGGGNGWGNADAEDLRMTPSAWQVRAPWLRSSGDAP